MTSCAHCRQRILSKEIRVNCNGCKRNIHERCLARFLTSPKTQECCSRNFATSINSIDSSGPVIPRFSDQTTARTSLFDSARNIDLNNSFSSTNSMNLDSTMHNVNNLSNNLSVNGTSFPMPMQPSMAGAHSLPDYRMYNTSMLNRCVNFQSNDSHQTQGQNSMFSQQGPNSNLPSNWYQLSEVQRSGMLFQMLAQNQTTMQSLAQDYREIRTELSDYSMRLSTLEKSHTCSSNNTATQKKKKCQNPRTRPYIPYVFQVADSESVVHLTPSPQGQGQVKVKFTKLTATKV